MRPVNLLPEQQRPLAPTGRRSGSAYVVLGSLAVVLVAAIAYVVTANQVTSSREEAARLSASAAAAEQKAEALAPFGRFRDLKQVRAASVEMLARGRLDWERLAREVALVLPKETWLTGMRGSTNAAGHAPTTTAGAQQPVGPTLTLTGCARNQPAVAATLVRLRRLNGALEAELTHSTRADREGDSGGSGSGGAGATDCGRHYGFEATVRLAPPETGETEPEGGEVPVSLGGGS